MAKDGSGPPWNAQKRLGKADHSPKLGLMNLCQPAKRARRCKGFRLSLAMVAAALVVSSCGRQSGSAPASKNAAPTAPAPDIAARPELAKLVGQWERSDGDYTIAIRSAGADGKLDAAYFNPGPIHVARAIALPEKGKTKIFVELQDVNYPGCTYSLQYDPSADQLYGTYFQAAVQETYDVTFARKAQQ